jgi:hypothetical protein
LRNAYKDINNELGQWLKLFFGLPFLPSDKIEDAFLTLIAECPSLVEVNVFTDYYRHILDLMRYFHRIFGHKNPQKIQGMFLKNLT